MDLDELLKKKKKEYKNKLELAMEEVAESARDFAPFGHTGQLKSGITPLKVIERDRKLTGIIISSAIDEDGLEYAGKIHDLKLRHASSKDGIADKSYIDFSKIPGDYETRYQSGYEAEKDNSQRYATKYLNRGYEEAKDRVLKIMDNPI